jgi:hypothetical protein
MSHRRIINRLKIQKTSKRIPHKFNKMWHKCGMCVEYKVQKEITGIKLCDCNQRYVILLSLSEQEIMLFRAW